MLTPDQIMQAAVDADASDIHMEVGLPPTLRINGDLQKLDDDIITVDRAWAYIKHIARERHLDELEHKGGSDFAYEFNEIYFFRVSIFRQQRRPGCVMRLIPPYKRSLEAIGLGEKVTEILYKPRGLVLITGPTGSGKSSTLAAMIDHVNKHRSCNIITIEDPIEYRHDHGTSIVVQREVGEDVPSFEEAIVKALRQDPDVILVGEMRNLETIEAAIRAAETGHLVFSTLHTTGAVRTVDRIVDVFPANHRDEVRMQLSGSLQCVISQQLLPLKDEEGRIAVFEIMFNTPSIAAYIRENKTFRITSDLQTGAKYGMTTMDASLLKHYLAGRITYQIMVERCYDRDSLDKLLRDAGAAMQSQRAR
jgi:twitching motility protein PilT